MRYALISDIHANLHVFDAVLADIDCRPKDGDWRAGYVRLTFTDGGAQVEFVRVPYDVDAAAQSVLTAGLPEEFAEFLRLGGKAAVSRVVDDDGAAP